MEKEDARRRRGAPRNDRCPITFFSVIAHAIISWHLLALINES